jgi:phospholipid/cholesterol/gamma-HCH transport system ATP-binding protein
MKSLANEKNIIEVKHLSVAYDQKEIVRDISFQVKAGEIFYIIGGSGSGKTTIFNQLIGLQTPIEGHIWIDGDDIVTAYNAERLKILRKIGVMYQSGALFSSMSLLENVRLPLEEFSDLPSEAKDMIALNKLQMVGLGDFARYMPSELSGGMQKRAAIARAMVLDPQILFLDEPSAGLDPITSAQIDKLILSLSHAIGITFVVVSHELASIFAVANRIILISEGKIIAEGDPRQLREHYDNILVKKFFNREV